VFGDIRRFSKLNDGQRPVFVDTVLGVFAKVIRRRSDVLPPPPAGDPPYLAFAAAAKHCALDLQVAMAGIDLATVGLLDRPALPIGGHYGPVYAG
jgi:hypothetical protein